MMNTIAAALHILGHFWLEEVQPTDLETIQALPDLAETLPQADAATLTELAVEYQRLFGFNLPPYESVFVDPSAMLMAPATERVQRLYRLAGWVLPDTVRTGAPDHLGLQLLALADWVAASEVQATDLNLQTISWATQLHTQHLALWVPPFVLAFQQLNPHPFYAVLSSLTLELLLSTLPAPPLLPAQDPFPDLPPPPIFRSSDQTDQPDQPETGPKTILRSLIKRLLTPRRAGLYLTRETLAHLSHALGLAATVGDRYQMLEALLQGALQYELLPDLVKLIVQHLGETAAAYQQLASDYPAWQPYATAWCMRLSKTEHAFEELM